MAGRLKPGWTVPAGPERRCPADAQLPTRGIARAKLVAAKPARRAKSADNNGNGCVRLKAGFVFMV
jgi:hypothetical protein